MIPHDLPTARPHPVPPGLSRRSCLQLGTRLLGGLATACCALPAAALAQTDHSGGDPLESMQWPQLRRQFIGNEKMQFSSAVEVKGPPMADDAMNVPLMVDARGLLAQGQEIDRIVIVADRNPVQHVATFMPRKARPLLALRFRLEQASPVRALVRTSDGQWHVGQTWINAAGGGCTVPGASRSDGSWSRTVSENPLLTFELDQRPPGPLTLQGRDNNGNRIEHEVRG